MGGMSLAAKISNPRSESNQDVQKAAEVGEMIRCRS
jgi:hypothetical protein